MDDDQMDGDDGQLVDGEDAHPASTVVSPPNSPASDLSMEDGELLSDEESLDACLRDGDPLSSLSVTHPPPTDNNITGGSVHAADTATARRRRRSARQSADLSSEVSRRILASLGVFCDNDDNDEEQVSQDGQSATAVPRGAHVWRREALHVHGVSQLSTAEVLEYFGTAAAGGRRPALVEWVDERSCNVVWPDERAPLLALQALSSPISRSTAAPDAAMPDATAPAADEAEESVDAAELGGKAVLPPGRWRLGVPHPNAQLLLMRLAHRADKPLPLARQSGALCKVYGDPRVKGVSGVFTARHRRQQQQQQQSVTTAGQNPWGDIAASWATAEAIGRSAGVSSRDFDRDVELALLRGGGGGGTSGGDGEDLRHKLSRQPHAETQDRTGMTTRRRKLQPHSNSSDVGSGSDSDEHERATVARDRAKRPRMRMRADDVPVSAGGDLRRRLTSFRGRGRNQSSMVASRDDDQLTAFSRDSANEDVQQEAEEVEGKDTDWTSQKKPLNIKITRDFSDVESEDDEASGAELMSDSSSGSDAGVEETRLSPAPAQRKQNEAPANDHDDDDEEMLDRRTDKNSSSDLRALLQKRRAIRCQMTTPVS